MTAWIARSREIRLAQIDEPARRRYGGPHCQQQHHLHLRIIFGSLRAASVA